jgi:LysM repeat protein
MNSSHRHRRPQRARRAGRHARPSQLQNVAETAGKAAPAMAIAGVLIASPQAHAAMTAPARAAAVIEQVHYAVHQAQARTQARTQAGPARQARTQAGPARQASPVSTDALVQHHEQARSYTVRRGDTLSSIAQRFYGSPDDWAWLYQANRSVLASPNVIYPGQVLSVPYEPPASGTAAPATASSAAGSSVLTTSAVPSGTLGCSGLEELWQDAGGWGGAAVLAASIAMAESSGQQYATGGVGERGYWQINPNHGSLSTYDPLGNAKAAVILSDDGTNWTPWTTYTSGAYLGRC